jgi:type II secretion system protein H
MAGQERKMTSATGQPEGRPSCRRGFTLIELIVVLTLLAIVASLIAPSLSSFMAGRSLDSEARRLLSLTRAAQSRAVSEGTPMLLWINATQGSYGVEREATSEKNDPKALEFSVDGNVRVAVPNPASAGTRLRNLPTIRFLPDGAIDENSPQTLRLNDTTGATLWLVQTRNRMGYEIRSTNK